MTAFHEVQFPPSLSYGARGGPAFNTTILQLASGYERRNQNWQVARASYDVSHAVKTQAQMDALRAFFYERRGRAYGFRFKDWADYKLPNDGDVRPTMMTTDGGTTTSFQIVKVYGSGTNNYTRTISKPVAGTVRLFADAVETFSFSVNTATGVVTLNAPLVGTTGKVITMQCEFDVPVRFDVDDMQVEVSDVEALAWGSIMLVEIRL